MTVPWLYPGNHKFYQVTQCNTMCPEITDSLFIIIFTILFSNNFKQRIFAKLVQNNRTFFADLLIFVFPHLLYYPLCIKSVNSFINP